MRHELENEGMNEMFNERYKSIKDYEATLWKLGIQVP